MPSQRRTRTLALLSLIALFVIIYLTRSGTTTRASDFYTKTQEALQSHEYAEAARQRDAESVGSRLKAAEEAAKKIAEEKDAEYRQAVEGAGKDKSSVAGRVKLDAVGGVGKETPVPGVAAQGGPQADQPPYGAEPPADDGRAGRPLLDDGDRDLPDRQPGPLRSENELGVEEVGPESALLDDR